MNKQTNDNVFGSNNHKVNDPYVEKEEVASDLPQLNQRYHQK